MSRTNMATQAVAVFGIKMGRNFKSSFEKKNNKTARSLPMNTEETAHKAERKAASKKVIENENMIIENRKETEKSGPGEEKTK